MLPQMFASKQGLLVTAISTFFVLSYLLYQAFPWITLEDPSLIVYPHFYDNHSIVHLTPTQGNLLGPFGSLGTKSGIVPGYLNQENVKNSDTDYNRVVVIPCISKDNISWVGEFIPDQNVIFYTADDQNSIRHPPRNKGNEVMIYLTYIIDHYLELPDVIVFMHAHRHTWHNSDLLGFDAVEMIKRLRNSRVVRLGYVNMRCAWVPGCPEWLHPYSQEELVGKQEQAWLARSWHELFPLDNLPPVLSQPCCAQFAVSRERVHWIPIERFIFYRDWLIETPYSNYVSGRIWEFIWQYVFTGHGTYCPVEHICYCDGFGVCFGGEIQYQRFIELRTQKSHYELQLKDLQQKKIDASEGFEVAKVNATLHEIEIGREVYLQDRISALVQEIEDRKQEALERGQNFNDKAKEIDQGDMNHALKAEDIDIKFLS